MAREVLRQPRSGWEAVKPRLVTKLENLGLPLPQKPPGKVPTLVDDITDWSDKELMTVLKRLTEWQHYADVVASQAEVAEKYAEGNLRKVNALNSIAHKSEKTVTAAKAAAYEDPNFIQADADLTEAYAYRKLTSDIATGLADRKFVVSRELTRRLGRYDKEGKGAA